MAINNHIYSDLDLRFTPLPTTGDVAMRYDAQAVIDSVKNLLNTNKYDRPFQPDVSSGMNALLFEPMTSITATLIENEIVRVLNNYEPRVTINSVTVVASSQSNSFKVSLSVFIGNQTQPTSINLILQRTR
jgi:phage baseplate assembly protein W